MSILLSRAPSAPTGTFGILSIDGAPICLTCELPWLNNAPNISCIPVSPIEPVTKLPIPYHFVRHISADWPLGNTWEATNVPGRTGILLHNANEIAQLKGCLAVGDKFGNVNGLPAVLDSVATLVLLNHLLPEEFDLIIRSA